LPGAAGAFLLCVPLCGTLFLFMKLRYHWTQGDVNNRQCAGGAEWGFSLKNLLEKSGFHHDQ
jgi:hypothetical protein